MILAECQIVNMKGSQAEFFPPKIVFHPKQLILCKEDLHKQMKNVIGDFGVIWHILNISHK